MFCKNKSIPASTFIPTPPRVMAIIQLCLSFTLLLCILGYPFMGQHYILKSRLLVFDSVIQTDLFKALPMEKQNVMLQGREFIKSKMGNSFTTKVSSSLTKFATTALFKQAWIGFSIVIALLILLKAEGAVVAAWILPFLALIYTWDNYHNGWKQSTFPEEMLFPSEKLLIDKYLSGKLSSNIFNQREELIYGWHLYLIDEWAKEIPVTEPLLFKEQVARGEFAFNLKRASLISQIPLDRKEKKESFLLLSLYIAWNSYFAWFVNRKKWLLV
jgi:hypothetical protein